MFGANLRSRDTLSIIVCGEDDVRSFWPKKYLTDEEETICVNLIQWLGSPVGQGFLRDCGFTENK